MVFEEEVLSEELEAEASTEVENPEKLLVGKAVVKEVPEVEVCVGRPFEVASSAVRHGSRPQMMKSVKYLTL